MEEEKMLLCKHCIDYLRSRGEEIFVGVLAYYDYEAEEENVCCDWCGEIDDLYECL